MEILRQKQDDVVIAANGPFEIYEHGVLFNGKLNIALNDALVETLNVESVPEDFSPYVYTYRVADGWQYTALGTQMLQEKIDQAIPDKRAEINAFREDKLVEGFTYSFPDGIDGVVQIRNERDLTVITGIAASGVDLVQDNNTTDQVYYIDKDDVQHWMTGTQAKAFGKAVNSFVGTVYAIAKAHKDALKSLAQIEPLDQALVNIHTYDFSDLWPE